jgi:release factor glutamine methyltransferase
VLFALDLSSPAASTTLATLEKNVPGKFSSVVQCDLLSCLRASVRVDVLVFNPPYVPTDKEDAWAGQVAYAWKGGIRGMEITWKVLDSLPVISLFGSIWYKDILSPDGVFYLVAVERNKPQDILARMNTAGIAGEVCRFRPHF